jgi:hypothetical protein
LKEEFCFEDIVTSDASDLERRVHAYREQLKAKKAELEKLKQRKNKEILRRQEDELKKQIEVKFFIERIKFLFNSTIFLVI